MQIRYNNTLEQLVSLQKYVLRNTAFGQRMMLHRFITVEAIIVFIAVIFAINHNPFKVLLGFIIVSSLAWLFRERSVLLQFKRDFKRERNKDDTGLFDKERLLSISPEGITVTISGNENHHPWKDVVSVGRDRKHIYIIMTGVLHYVIPLAALADLKEADRFMQTADRYRSI